jgi:hypothetical protein
MKTGREAAVLAQEAGYDGGGRGLDLGMTISITARMSLSRAAEPSRRGSSRWSCGRLNKLRGRMKTGREVAALGQGTWFGGRRRLLQVGDRSVAPWPRPAHGGRIG